MVPFPQFPGAFMIFSGFRQLRGAGVLGMNKRNADFIMRQNPRSAYPLVDNKVLTKRVAERMQIPTPPVYYVVEHHQNLAGLEAALGDRREFVLKPARGSGGSGIILISDRDADSFITQSGARIAREDFFYHISDILSGVFSLEGLEDSALVEALIRPDPVFAEVTYQGVPDIRIVVYRGVPAMAMVRLPTRASDGKANLHRGAIGAGIELRTGKTVSAVHHSVVIQRHPDTGKPVRGIQVPCWESMLRIGAQALEMTGLGYLGVDLILDREQGPLLLELNARPGLAIQMANQLGLAERLEQIDRLGPGPLGDPEARVAWAREAFGKTPAFGG
jgi:alpha-L-glutamate ligase-like protein